MRNYIFMISLALILQYPAVCGGSDIIPVDRIQVIQDQIDGSEVGDTVFVSPGHYSGLREYRNRFGSTVWVAIVMRSGVSVVGVTGKPEDVVIDCGGEGYGILFESVDGSTRLSGLSVQNASWAVSGENSSPKIMNCFFENNGDTIRTPNCAGTGMYFDRSSLVVTDCVFRGNIAGSGAGACFSMGSIVLLERCHFIGNLARRHGGGIVVGYESQLTLEGCIIESNSAKLNGGGIYCSGQSLKVTGGSIVGNSAGQQGGGCDLVFLNKPAEFSQVTILENCGQLGSQGIDIPIREVKLVCCETDTTGWEGWFAFESEGCSNGN